MFRALARNCDAPIDDKKGANARSWTNGKPVRVVRVCLDLINVCMCNIYYLDCDISSQTLEQCTFCIYLRELEVIIISRLIGTPLLNTENSIYPAVPFMP